MVEKRVGAEEGRGKKTKSAENREKRSGSKQLSNSNGILQPTATAASKEGREQRKKREEGREQRDWKRDGWPDAKFEGTNAKCDL